MTNLTRQLPRADRGTNHFLARLQPKYYDALIPPAKIVAFKFRRRMRRQNDRVDAVHFPLTCMFSLLVSNDGQPQTELAMIGKEGIIRATEVFQVQGAMGLSLVQVMYSAGGINT